MQRARTWKRSFWMRVWYSTSASAATCAGGGRGA